MTKKIFGTKQITHLIYGILMLLPFLSILSTCAYVSLNKNAYESWSGATYIEKQAVYYQTNNVETQNDINVDNIYKFNGLTTQSSLNQFQVYFYLNVDLVFEQFNISYENIKESRIFQISSNKLFVDLRDNNNTQIWTYELTESTHAFNFIPISISNTNIFFIDDISSTNYLYVKEYIDVTQQETLDDVFDYSISKFVKDNDNYNIHFFDWFGNLFLKNGNTGVNAIYLNFINWYLNYALLVSVGYILFLLMLWFINFVRKILEGGNSFGHGGF